MDKLVKSGGYSLPELETIANNLGITINHRRKPDLIIKIQEHLQNQKV
jgi:hypothetical protein